MAVTMCDLLVLSFAFSVQVELVVYLNEAAAEILSTVIVYLMYLP